MSSQKIKKHLWNKRKHTVEERSLLIISSSADKSMTLTQNLRSSLTNMVANLRQFAEQIELNPRLVMPVFQFSVEERRLDSPGTIRRRVEEECARNEHCRAVIILHDGSDEFMREPCRIDLAGTGVSHLIEIGLGSSLTGWHACQGTSCARVIVGSALNLPHVIEDIALDIAYFNALCGEQDLCLERKQIVSSVKSAVAVRELNGRSSAFGPIHGVPGYVSLASLCHPQLANRRKQNPETATRIGAFDFERYERLWNEVMQEAGNPCPPAQAPEWEEFYKQFKQFRDAGSMNDQAAFKAWKKLAPGRHLLARISSKCGNRDTNETLCKIFGGTKPRIGKWKFFDESKIDHLARYANYISFFFINR